MRNGRVLSILGFVLSLSSGSGEAVQRRGFVTSITGTGNLSSWPGASGTTPLQRADAICRARAVDGALDNANSYRAWLSTEGTDAYCHVQGLSGKKDDDCDSEDPPIGGPWYNTNSPPVRPFLPELAELTGYLGSPFSPAQYNEYGNSVDPLVASDRIWTGSDHLGEVWPTFTCSNWGSASAADDGGSGLAHGTGGFWSGRGSLDCSEEARLLCLEPGESDPVSLPWFPGVLAFLTSASGSGDLSTWPEAGGATGLDAGDAICQALAEAAFLPSPDQFVAWLSTDDVDAKDRLTAAGPFRRVDRLLLANDVAGLLDGVIGNTLHVDENGTRMPIAAFAWTGTYPDGLADDDTCANWTTDTDQLNAGHGIVVNSSSHWTYDTAYARTCDTANHRLYCFSNVLTLFWDGFEITHDTSRWSSTSP